MEHQVKAVILDDAAMRRAISRISYEIIERNRSLQDVCLLGILGSGPLLASRIRDKLCELEGAAPPCGRLDPSPHRDDLRGTPPADGSEIPFSLNGKRIVLVDDVVHTGRTVRAAIDSIMSRGRPACIQLAVLVDRGHRELPIRPDYVGKNLPTARDERVVVRFAERDGVNSVVLVHRGEEL